MQLTKLELEELLDKIEKFKGRQTELISVYIPEGYDVNSVQRQIEAEKGTAKNIKSTSTRKNVSEALDKIVRHLKGLKKTPPNGLAIFSGNVSRIEGQSDLQLWDIEPPMPLRSRLYRCDKDFVLEPLREMLEVDEVFGLLVMDRKEATIGLLEGKRIDLLHKMTSGVPSKVKAGGQCCFPETIINVKDKGEIKLNDVNEGDLLNGINFKNMGMVFNKCLKKWTVNKDKFISIYAGNKEIFTSLDHIFYVSKEGKIVQELAKDLMEGDLLIGEGGKLIKISSIDINNTGKEMVDIEVENHNFLANGLVVHNSSQRFHRITEGLTRDFYNRIAEQMKEIFFDMKKLKGIIVGGPIPTKDEFLDGDYLVTKLREKVIGVKDIGDSNESGLKELVAKSQDILANQEIIKEKKLMEKFFDTLGRKPDLSTLGLEKTKQALQYGASEIVFVSTKIKKEDSKEIKKMALNVGSNFELISTETEEGEQFYNLSGIGSILRFKI